MEKQKVSKLEIEIIVAFLEANLRTGKPTIRETIGYLKRKYKLYDPENIIDLDEKKNKGQD